MVADDHERIRLFTPANHAGHRPHGTDAIVVADLEMDFRTGAGAVGEGQSAAPVVRRFGAGQRLAGSRASRDESGALRIPGSVDTSEIGSRLAPGVDGHPGVCGSPGTRKS